MEILWLIIGLACGSAIGAAVGWLVADRKSRASLGAMQTELAVAKERERESTAELQEQRATLDALRGDVSTLQQSRASLDAMLQAEKQALLDAREMIAKAQAAADAARTHVGRLENERSTLVANLEAEKKSLQEQRDHLASLGARLREAFAELSVEALKKNTDTFFNLAEQKFKTLQTEAAGSLEQKKAEMAQLISPMQQTLEAYKTKLDDIEKARGQAYVDIKQHLTEVATTQKNLSTETRQLVQALRKPQGRGRWGELTLRRLFEMAGLADRVTFHEQVSTEDGKLRPDCIVQLPESRQVIIDSKCVIDAFLDATECADDGLRRTHLERHAQQVRTRVSELSRKAYWEQFEHAPDFVVLFLPGEPFLYAAVENDPTLIEDALKDRIIVAAPSALLGLLRIIEHGWRQKQIEQSATEIRDLAGTLYERINKMADHFVKLGRAISNVNDKYNDTVASLERMVLPAARRMSEMGIGDGQSTVKELDEVETHVRELSRKSWKELPASAPVE